ncbi:MAG: hypothetical protein FWF78_02365 [Defluviitaleaceae bacterium]|nr:hypothetical protein [Defluviitaleaceae bacterium]
MSINRKHLNGRPDVINLLLKNIVIETINKFLHYERKIDCLTKELFIEISREFHNAEHPMQDMPI